MQKVELLAVPGLPMVKAGDDLASLIGERLTGELALRPGDVLVLAQKIVSKAEGRLIDLATIAPSERAVALAKETGKDARVVELTLEESTEVLRHRTGVLIVAHKLGLVLANAGIDRSNVDGPEHVLLLPRDPDRSCAELRRAIAAATGVEPGVMIIDSIGRAWRNGTIGTAIGVAGLPGLLDLRNTPDLFGRPLETTEVGLADELAAAASLVMGQVVQYLKPGDTLAHIYSCMPDGIMSIGEEVPDWLFEAKAAGVPLRAGEVTIGLRIPAWARLKTPAAAAS